MKLPRSTPMVVAVGALALMLTAVPASAQTIFFGEDLHGNDLTRATPTNSGAAETNFLSALTADVGTETFESFSEGDLAPINLVFPGAGTAVLNGGGEIENVISGTDGNGRYPISGVNFWETDLSSFTIDFTTPVAAFGFYGVDIGDFGTQLFVTLVDEAALETTIKVPHSLGVDGSTTGSIFFWGFVDASAPFTSVQFAFDGSNESFAFDNMTIGSVAQVVPPTSVVPEPASVLLLATGLAGLGLVGVRRRKQGSSI